MVFSMGQYLDTVSNMENMGVNSTAEIAEADDPALRFMRLFTVSPSSSSTAYPDLNEKELEQKWTAPSAKQVATTKAFSYFSAVCWYHGKTLYKKFNPSAIIKDGDAVVPMGLFVSAFGGTRVHQWSSPDALAKCNQTAAGKGIRQHQTHNIQNQDVHSRVTSTSSGQDPSLSSTIVRTGTVDFDVGSSDDSVHWNAMIAPILRMRFKGMVWLVITFL
jgi:hypothetical protein